MEEPWERWDQNKNNPQGKYRAGSVKSEENSTKREERKLINFPAEPRDEIRWKGGIFLFHRGFWLHLRELFKAEKDDFE